MAPKSDMKQKKASSLSEEGVLNPSSAKVRDPKFQEGDFFDPRDLVQVKYEMLRRVHVEKATVTEAADEYGFSRTAFYQAKSNFDEAGISGLIPAKRGPHGPHKLNAEVLDFLRSNVEAGKPIRARKLAEMVLRNFGIKIHPRTIERMLIGKKTPQ